MLFNLPEFRDYYTNGSADLIANSDTFAPNDMDVQIRKLAIGLQSGEYSQRKIAAPIIPAGEEVKADAPEEVY